MSKLTLISRSYGACSRTVLRFTSVRPLYTSNVVRDEEDEKDSKSEVPKEQSEAKAKQEEVKAKLNELLLSMSKKSTFSESVKKINIPRPRVEAQKKAKEWKEKRLKDLQEVEENELGNRLTKAAQAVAKQLGGDTEKTQQELLDIYLTSKTKLKTDAADATVAAEQDKTSEESGVSKPDLKDLISSMKVDKQVPEEYSRARQVRVLKSLTSERGVPVPSRREQSIRPRAAETVDIFSQTPLGIFSTDENEEQAAPVETPVWDYLYQRDLRLSVTHPPANIFEQLILWTEQGKIWKFPIDNEQDWHEEKNIDFTEHVFLEKWLEPWCPSTGPLRHFMELVCVGLSKNPYMSASEKQAHILFFEHYFRGRNSLLADFSIEPVKDRPSAEQQQV